MKTRKEKYFLENFPEKELRELGFFNDSHKTIDQMCERVCTFFGLKNIFMYDFIIKPKNEIVKADIETFSEN